MKSTNRRADYYGLLKDRKNIQQVFFIILAVWLFGSSQPGYTIEISDIPMATQIRKAPPNIMFVLDNSGSMDCSIMADEQVRGEWNGNRCYVFDNPGDNINEDGYILNIDERNQWKSQWSGENIIYYNPQVDYLPWPLQDQDPDTNGIERMPNADPTTPVSNPYFLIDGNNGNDNWTLNLTEVYDRVPEVIVDNQDESGFVATGHWLESDVTPEWNGSSVNTITTGDYAIFTPTISQSGSYAVSVWWGCSDDSDTYALITVTDTGGTSSVRMNQQTTCGDWADVVGTYNFLDGNAGRVAITRDAESLGSYTIADAVRIRLNIYNAHYYTQDPNGVTYLVNFNNGVRDVYRINDQNNIGIIDTTGELELIGNELPVSIRPDFYDDDPVRYPGGYINAANELQNFANWYTYYRKRELAAKAAVGEMIVRLEGVKVGFYSLHENSGATRQSVLPVSVQGETDETSTLLTNLYSMNSIDSIDSDGGTPLRTALQNVGRYFDDTDGNDGGLGSSPYAALDQGGACQHALAIVMTDGFWNGASPGVGNTDNGEGAPYADGYSDTLADVAMYYYNKDLSDSLNNEVSTTTCDDNDQQHMVTFTVSFGMNGTLNPDDYNYVNDPCFLDLETPIPSWGDPTENSLRKIDDLWHAAINGRGQLFSTSDSEKLVNAIVSITGAGKQIMASGAPVAITDDILSEDTKALQTFYDSETWTGDLVAYSFDNDGNINVDPPLWRASTDEWDARRIVTYDGTSGVSFQYDSLSDAQKEILKMDADDTLDENEKEIWARNTVDYIRGKTDIPGFRQRLDANSNPNVLGDIVHSAPVIQGDTVYVGANDGMLHAFNIETGEERFAYVPNLVFENLPLLKELSFQHRFFVDATPVIQEDVGDSDITLLVGGLGKGGKGFYVLDVTNAESIDEGNAADIVLWEYPADNDNDGVIDVDDDMGFSYSKPFIVKSNDTDYPWIVIFGNGYNSSNGHAVLYILDALTGKRITKIDANNTFSTVTIDEDENRPDNGLSSPTVIGLNEDYKADVVYAGDLEGNLWKFDLHATEWESWSVAFNENPLFTARGPDDSNIQPITYKPAVMSHCQEHGFIVNFGTGKFLGEPDRTDTDGQTLYGIWDFADWYPYTPADDEYLGTFDRTGLGLSNLSNVTLLKQEIDSGYSDETLRVTSDKSIDWAANNESPSPDPDIAFSTSDPPKANAGWFFDLPIVGERMFGDAMIRGGRFISTTIVPDDSFCSGGGESILNEFDACDGSRPADPPFDVNGDGKITAIDDEIEITVSGNTEWIAPTSINLSERSINPSVGFLNIDRSSIVAIPDANGTPSGIELKIATDSTGAIVSIVEKAPRRGVLYWKQR